MIASRSWRRQLRLNFAETRASSGGLTFLGMLLLGLVGCAPQSPTATMSERGDTAARMMRAMGPVSSPPQNSNFRLDDVALVAGVDFAYRNGEEAEFAALPELVGGGVAITDFDQDGGLDLVLPGGGRFGFDDQRVAYPTGLFRNRGEMKFESVARSAGMNAGAESRLVVQGAFADDYDNDGFPDLLLVGYGGVRLLHNLGDGTFEEATAACGLGPSTWVTGAIWADVNRDGASDLYLVQFVDWSTENHPVCPGRSDESREYCDPADFRPLPDSLWLSNGEGTFRDASAAWNVRRDGRGLGAVAGDIDGDGDIDLSVSNYGGPNFLYRNDGGERFTEMGEVSGAGTSREGMFEHGAGIDLGDLDQDSHVDLWSTNCDREMAAFHRNVGPDLFYHSSHSWGVAGAGSLYAGWGTAVVDIDSDQDLDILVMAGHRLKFPRRQPRRQMPVLLENHFGERVANVAPQMRGFFSQSHDARGVAVGDLDNDGDPDVVVSCLNQPVALLENRCQFPHRSLQLRLIGTHGSRSCGGTRVLVTTATQDQTLVVRSGGGMLSTHDPRMHVGLGSEEKIGRLRVAWPGGAVSEFQEVVASGPVTLIEPSPGSNQE